MVELKSYGILSNQGPHLNINEDVVDIDLTHKLFMIIDGFGGSNIGDVAANIAKESIKRSYTKIASDPDSTLPFFYSHKYLIEGNALINAFQIAHQAMVRENDPKPLSKKGGASVLVGAMAENVMTFVSTGNCMLYLYRQGHLSSIINPDTMVALNRDNFSKFHQTIPLSGLGLFEDLHYQVREVKIANGDILIFLTDGIYGRLDETEIKFNVERNIDREVELLKSLSKLSNERGNLDNQSGLVLQF
jgi:serine/threonine protein phosphatase PrpC